VDEIRTDLGDVQGKVEKIQQEFTDYKSEVEQKFLELKATFDKKANAVSTQVPSLTVAQQSTVEEKFQALLLEAKAVQSTFVVGKINNEQQTVTMNTLIKRHFERFEAKLLPVVGKSQTRRFAVPPEKVEDVKNTIRHYNTAIRDLGWWVVQDAPPALRRLNSNAYTFFKYARDQFPPLRKVRFEAENGYLKIDDSAFLPVYLVPTNRAKWKQLASLLMELAVEQTELDWLEAATSPFVLPEGFVEKWCMVLRRGQPHRVNELGGSHAEGSSDGEMEEDIPTVDAAEGGG
jgi:hypothetical protein